MEDRLAGLWAEARELGLGAFPRVDRLDSPPSPLMFFREYVSANKPCLITDAARHWPAISHSLWSCDAYLTRALARDTVSVHLTPDGRADALVPIPGVGGSPSSPSSLCFASACVRTMSFPDALRLVLSSASPSSPFVAYAQQQDDCFRSEYSALAHDVDPHVPWATEALGCLPEAVNLWIGNGRSETSFHKDHYENLYTVVSGEKHFLLLPPTEVHRLYVRPYTAARYASSGGSRELRLEVEEPARYVPWCSVNPYPSSTESLEREVSSFPRYFKGPKPFECTVKAGDILYLPSMWFHHVRQTPDRNGRTIAINYWYDMRFDIKYAYFNFLQSIEQPPRTDDPLGDDSEEEGRRDGGEEVGASSFTSVDRSPTTISHPQQQAQVQ